MKFFTKYIFDFIIFLTLIQFKGKIKNAVIQVNQSIVPNECSSLGRNNPLRLLDCSIFQLNKGLCCLLTITHYEMECDEDGVCGNVEYFRTACIVLAKKDSKLINETSMKYKYLGDVLIECSQNYIKYYLLFIVMQFFFLFF